ncbi:hypothetical protein V6S02_05990 [Microbacterium sp. CCNWLW134]|uniref:hypothetical protein n=1 Tax=Microbacterium sp. CCNWLW134 TaxID=3122064 RepID=UPI00300F8131
MAQKGIAGVLDALREETETESSPKRIDALIEAAKKRVMESFDVEIGIGDDIYSVVTFTEVRGVDWGNVTALSPPRESVPADFQFGFNPDAAVEHYPASAIRVDGEPVTSEQWKELVGYLDAAARVDMASALWAVHELKPRQQLAALVAKKKEASDGK